MMRYGALIVGVLAAALCGRLGFWQLQRLDERRRSNAVIEANLLRAALPPDRWIADSVDYRRAAATGVFDFERQLVIVARSRQGTPGVHVVTPLQLADGSAILVERGFAPSPDGRSVDLDELAEPDSARVEGVVLPRVAEPQEVPASAVWPAYVRRADPIVLQPLYPYPLRSRVLRRTTPAIRPSDVLWTLEVPRRSTGPHLSYAVQWFAFATIALVGGVILATRSASGDRRAAVRAPPPAAG
jgi:cytochrome oxidase assembly protein ShyY1